MAKRLEGVGWNALFLENHDQPRSVSTWGGDDQMYRDQSAKCLATMYFLMKGTPFIYQGQEIGMMNVQYQSIDDYNDVAIKNMYHNEIAEGKSHKEIMQKIWKSGRDNSRTPMQWNHSVNAGFSTGNPWLKVNSNYEEINVAIQQNDPKSILNYYKKLIALRKHYDVLVYGKYQLELYNHHQVYAYTRHLNENGAFVIANLFNKKTVINVPSQVFDKSPQLVLSNESDVKELAAKITLKPYEALVYVW
ncbi:alpha-glucosidase [Gracilibacillus boraciitolerans JCM 21714]|uniref:Alpha-glucosidase n=1 Tax=Gracilibacillus boraciitolerans JCM 21714 TaxID=1298598 RepID=W4VQF2_9BACI|nr:alpha-glucosidase [Gracilibacillus boraciitolerans JCM 21714]